MSPEMARTAFQTADKLNARVSLIMTPLDVEPPPTSNSQDGGLLSVQRFFSAAIIPVLSSPHTERDILPLNERVSRSYET